MISIRKSPLTNDYAVYQDSEIVGRGATFAEAKLVANRLRRFIAKAQPKPLYTIWPYFYTYEVGPWVKMGVGWAYRIIKTGQWANGFPTEEMAKTEAEAVLRRTT